jgi:hypothetical protein
LARPRFAAFEETSMHRFQCAQAGARRPWPLRACLAAASLALTPALALALDGAADQERLASELKATQDELHQTREALDATRDTLRALSRKVEALEAAQPGQASRAAPGATARLSPVNADNPAVSFVVDTLGYANSYRDPTDNTANPGNGFDLQDAELFISAPIDPFLRGYATIAASSQNGFDVEEAALVTTALPWNLGLKGGRFFADVGRFSSYHPEALPFVDRPPSINRLIGGESSAEGAEVSWLAPLPIFAQLTVGAYNSIGANRREDPNAFGFPTELRSFSEMTYLGRPLVYLDITDDFNVELGGTYFAIPRDQNRSLYGLDVTFRHQPGSQDFYQGTTLGAEWMWNDERFPDVNPVIDTATGAPLLDAAGVPVLQPGRFARSGGYLYFESFFMRRFSLGARLDYSEAVNGAVDRLTTSSAFVTWMPSEFHRLRFQFDNFNGEGVADQRYTLQWTAFIGSHSHGFSNRAR